MTTLAEDIKALMDLGHKLERATELATQDRARSAAFAPVLHTLKIGVPFPPALLAKPTAANGSIHASSIISASELCVKESLQLWFEQAIAYPEHFDLEKPDLDYRQSLPTPEFMSFKIDIEHLGYTVWDIQKMTSETVEILLEDSNLVQRRLTGRADFIISSPAARIRQAASQYAVCVVEKQSKSSDVDCEHQLLAYMVILMNRFGLLKLAGILLYNNGTCRAYRASRDANSQGIYEENETFMMYQLPEILLSLLHFAESAQTTTVTEAKQSSSSSGSTAVLAESMPAETTTGAAMDTTSDIPVAGAASSSPPTTAAEPLATDKAPFIVQLSTRIIAILGTISEALGNELTKIGGKFNKSLQFGDSKAAGWTFPKKHLEDVQKVIPGVPYVLNEHKSHKATESKPTESKATPAAEAQHSVVADA